MSSQYREPQPVNHHRLHALTSCQTCGTAIGPRDRRLPWRIRDGDIVVRDHYCSDTCLPAVVPGLPEPAPRRNRRLLPVADSP